MADSPGTDDQYQALARFRYAGRQVETGETVAGIRPRDARLLMAVGKVAKVVTLAPEEQVDGDTPTGAPAAPAETKPAKAKSAKAKGAAA